MKEIIDPCKPCKEYRKMLDGYIKEMKNGNYNAIQGAITTIWVMQDEINGGHKKDIFEETCSGCTLAMSSIYNPHPLHDGLLPLYDGLLENLTHLQEKIFQLDPEKRTIALKKAFIMGCEI